MKIYIIRHGETKSNESGRLQGWKNDALNDRGVFLAEETGKALKGIHFDKVYSSPLKRACQTAEILLRESGNAEKIEIDERLKEIHVGTFEGKGIRDGLSESEIDFVKRFYTNAKNMPGFPEGESIKDVMNRTQDFLWETAEQACQTMLVSTHGCALRCMLNFLYDNPDDFWHGHIPYNCCINVVDYTDGKFFLVEDDLVLYDKRLCVNRYSI